MKKGMDRPKGMLSGDDKPMPNKGTGTGMTGHDMHLGGASTSQSATNRMGGIKGSTGSDSPDQCKASRKPRI